MHFLSDSSSSYSIFLLRTYKERVGSTANIINSKKYVREMLNISPLTLYSGENIFIIPAK
jgi:hypothetical protein